DCFDLDANFFKKQLFSAHLPSSIQREDETKMHEIPVIIRAHHDTSDIVMILGVGPHTAYRICKTSKGWGKPQRSSSKRKTGEIDPEAAHAVFKDNPKMNMTEFAEKKSVARTTVSNA
ncbi:Uncharacterized protein FKW44_003642, partial [Caligus rogercresseyi]